MPKKTAQTRRVDGLSKEASEGLEWGALTVEENLNFGIAPELAMSLVGIKSMEDRVFFFDWLRMSGRDGLLKRITQPPKRKK